MFPNQTPLIPFYSSSRSFNSLQTGRCFRTMKKKNTGLQIIVVSIPFKREGVSELLMLTGSGTFGFEFQFPSNGKVFPNHRLTHIYVNICYLFQFPSNGKVFPNEVSNEFECKCKKFQFPSNGKVFPNISRFTENGIELFGFNSLQTGRCFRTMLPLPFVSIA